MSRHDDRRWVERQPTAGGFHLLATGEASTALGFYNVNTGDISYFTELALKIHH
jgi:hypothetical protein